MPPSIHHAGEADSNALRDALPAVEPKALRTFTPTQAVLARSAGVYHWTPEDRRLYDFTSGVLVSNLGHNPTAWMKRFVGYMDWPAEGFDTAATQAPDVPRGFTPAVAMTATGTIPAARSVSIAAATSTGSSRRWGSRGSARMPAEPTPSSSAARVVE